MAELEQDLLHALQNLGSEPEKPCGCQEKTGGGMETNPFALEPTATGDLTAQLNSALDQISLGDSFDLESTDAFSLDEDLAALEFAALEEGPKLDLNDIVAAAEQYPGLKITFSY